MDTVKIVCALAMSAAMAVRAESTSLTAGNARFTLLAPRMVRCEWSADGVFEDRPSLVFADRDQPSVPFEHSIRGDGVQIKTAGMTLEWKGGAFNEANLFANGVAVLAEDKENLLGTQRTLDGKCALSDTLATMEKGLLSRRGVTVVDDTATPLFTENGWVAERPPREKGSYRDLVVFAYGHDYKGCLGDYVKVAGRIPMPPRWAFGYWWSRYWLYSDREVRDLVREIKSYGIPLDVFILDMEWHETWNIGRRTDLRDEFGQLWGWSGYTWNRRLFPDPRSTLGFLHDSGLKVALNLHPASGIQPVEDCYRAFAADYGWQGTNAVPFRADDEKWAACYFKDVIGPLEADGVDFWWLDWQQWPMSKEKPSLSNTFWLNRIFAAHSAARGGGGRPFIYHRWGGLGSHRYQVGFSGDCKIAWSMLEAIPWFTATASNVGYGYWGHDIGGFNRPDGSDGLDGELLTRWMQSAVFTPIFKTHGTKAANVEKRIWRFPDHFRALRDAVRLRYRLVPYIYTAAREAYDTGVSICRPMYYDWPELEAAYTATNACMFGDSILAATISKPMKKNSDVSEIDIWFPPGAWYDVSTGDLLEGGGVLKREYSISQNPWFAKAGAIIPMYPDSVENLSSLKTDDLVLFCVPGSERGECEIYEDDGENADYATNFRRTRVVRDGMRIVIGPRKGAYTLVFPATPPPTGATVNGGPCAWSYDAESLAVVVQTPAQDGSRETVVELVSGDGADALAKRLYGLKGAFARADAIGDEFKGMLRKVKVFAPAGVADPSAGIVRRGFFARNLPDSWLDFWSTVQLIADSPERMAEHLEHREEARKRFLAEIETVEPTMPREFIDRLRKAAER